MIRLALVDDHELFLKGLQGLLNQQKQLECQLIFTGAEALIEALPLKDTDVLLLDLQLPDSDAFDLLKKIRKIQPEIRVIYLTLLRGNRSFNRLSPLGFEGYLLKDSPIDALVEAIETVATGGTYYGNRYSDDHQNTVTTPPNKVLELLSNREIEVLKLVAQELSSAEIAARLFVSVSTVDSHRKNIMIKLGVDNIVGLVKIAVENKLI